MKRRLGRLEHLDAPLDFGDDLFIGLAVLAIVVAVVLAFVGFGIPLLLVGIDLLWLVIVFAGGVIGRLTLRRPWRIEALNDGDRVEWFVQGYRPAGTAVDHVANALRHGRVASSIDITTGPS